MNSFGKLFRISLFGESHGPLIGVVIDGVAPGIPLTPKLFEEQLERRKGGREGLTSRVESDQVHFLSGIYNNFTTGSPLTIAVKNREANSEEYRNLEGRPRPGHADFTALKKYKGFADPRGGGHFSGRVTVSLVIAGVVAREMINHLKLAPTLSITAKVTALGGVARQATPTENVDNQPHWKKMLQEAATNGDSLGGVVECRTTGVPIGLGEPFFDTVESLLSHIIFAIPGVKGIEFGDGFKAAEMVGSQHNDPIISIEGETSKNGSGGVNGGITNGNELLFRVAFKPTPSIAATQESINLKSGKVEPLTIKGRHDTAYLLRTPVIVEAATAIVLTDLLLNYGTCNRVGNQRP